MSVKQRNNGEDQCKKQEGLSTSMKWQNLARMAKTKWEKLQITNSKNETEDITSVLDINR